MASEPVGPRRLAATELDRLRGGGGVVVDTRDRYAFAAGHIPGSANIELDGEVGSYMKRLWAPGTRFGLVLGPDQAGAEVARQAADLGVEGVLDGGIEAWAAAGLPLARSRITDVEGMAAALGAEAGRALDVRRDDEWRQGRLPGATHVPIADLPRHLGELAGGAPIYVYCRSGHRASIGASLLAGAGIAAVLVDGGFPDWQAGGLPVERG